ncbi:fimbrillin family protein [Sphingobacterium rhinopitheci]|uniref:fimbrillin family protein n=1 Tax=Sphingobacterium rhinopitheci TaxID=2781960 RepID=UPI001F5273D5|nr:fimbrillin family protein [Sphingobacterium rhinopitheci]MCI0922087.1 fimbrillin family protein [Sphingobacterium rhinopitheci]
MKRQFVGAITICLMLLASCAKETVVDTNDSISFTGKITNLQAVAGPLTTSPWNTNDNIGVFMVDNGSNNVTENTINRQYTFSGNQFIPSLGNEIYFPVSNTKVDFIAYYPYNPTYQLGLPVVLSFNDQSNISRLDVLYAKSTNAGAGYNKTGATNVPLTFEHVLSKIIIRPIAGEGLSSTEASWGNMLVEINGLHTRCNFDLITGLVSSPHLQIPFLPYTRTPGVAYEAIAIPNEYTQAGSFSFKFQVGGNTYVFNSPANERFEPGKEYTYTITVNKTGLVVGNVTVNNWTSVSRTGTAN